MIEIETLYREFLREDHHPDWLNGQLQPTVFGREQLPKEAFKSGAHKGSFFRDCRGRVFPPDPYHGFARVSADMDDDDELAVKKKKLLEIILALRQRYRFGVTVRDGNVHYDVQYEKPRTLQSERMYCAKMGQVDVTGSHANVGVNDVIWVPDGKKDPAAGV